MNFDGVTNLINAVRKNPCVKRCVFTSSQLVCRVGYVPEHEQDYQPNTLYGESKSLGEKMVRREDGGGVVWCLVRPTTVWGPGMSSHYQMFFRMIARGLYFHVGPGPQFKSYGYVGNVVFQYIRLLQVPAKRIHRKTFYLADYKPLSLREWSNAFQRELVARPIWTCPEPLAKSLARIGDCVNLCGLKRFPFNSFRLQNVLTEYVFSLAETEKVCGPLPYSMEQGVKETAAWLIAERVVTGRGQSR